MQMEYERDWLSSLMRKYVDTIYKIPAEGEGTWLFRYYNH